MKKLYILVGLVILWLIALEVSSQLVSAPYWEGVAAGIVLLLATFALTHQVVSRYITNHKETK